MSRYKGGPALLRSPARRRDAPTLLRSLCGGKKARSSVDIIRRYRDQETRRRATKAKLIFQRERGGEERQRRGGSVQIFPG